MGTTKTNKILKLILSLYFFLFPLGQVFKLMAVGLGLPLYFHPTDILVVGSAVLGLYNFGVPKKLIQFGAIATFSYIFGALYLQTFDFIALFYLIRLLSYIYFGYSTYNLLKNGYVKTPFLIHLLVKSVIVFAAIGIVQYVVFPDLRSLYSFGWDDHYYRLASTFLDPSFSGILFVLGILLLEGASFKYKAIGQIFLSICLLLTYSRASYLSFLMSVGYLFVVRSKLRFSKSILVIFLVGLVGLVLLGGQGEGVNLFRTASIGLKMGNWMEGLELSRHSLLFGVGFNHLCIARHAFIPQYIFGINSCSGFDSSAIVALATNGIVGLIVLGEYLAFFWRKAKDSNYASVFRASLVAILVHSLFTNTLFYPWIMGWMAVLIAVSVTNQGE